MLDALVEATDDNTKSKATDRAIAHYCQCAGENPTHPNETYTELIERAVEDGNLTPEEISAILSTNELPVKCERE